MKKWLLFIMIMSGLTLATNACSPGTHSENNENLIPDTDQDPNTKPDDGQNGAGSQSGSRYLVLFSSRTGNTRMMANTIQATLNCDIQEVQPDTPYDINYDVMLQRVENELNGINEGHFPTIKTTIDNFEKYDVIFVGYPIWNEHMATPMQTFLHNNASKLSGKRIALFASSGSSEITTSINDARTLVPNATFTESLLLTTNTLEQMQSLTIDWLTKLNVYNDYNKMNSIKLAIHGGATLTATLVDNSSTRALKELLSKNDITINMSDYARMEKVGSLGTSLPRNDQQITTEAGDLILYQGNSFVIYYAPNSWNFTRLGKIDNMTQAELISALGSGNVTVTLSLNQ